MEREHDGLTVWFTGLSGAGKTTLCNAVHEIFSARGYRVEALDGDIVRRQVSPDLGFTKVDRDENIRRLGVIAEDLTRKGVIVLVAAISPYRAARDSVRQKINRFLEVYVDAPLEVCEQRDPKGLYRKARRGEILRFTGVDDPYEAPLAAEVQCKTDQELLQVSIDKVVTAMVEYLHGGKRSSV